MIEANPNTYDPALDALQRGLGRSVFSSRRYL